MLTKRIIPTVLVRGKTAYKGPGFGESCTRSVGSALSVCRTHAQRGVDELLILDIGATPEGRGPDLDLVRELSEGCFIPITVGGGVKSLEDIYQLLRAGADKVAIGEAARQHPAFIDLAAEHFGKQAIVQVVEYDSLPSQGDITIHCVSKSAGEIVVQCRDLDGTMKGYELGFMRSIASEMDAPVIVSGGCRSPVDMLEAFKAGADACAAGALFQFTDTTPRDCASYLKSQGLEVRL